MAYYSDEKLLKMIQEGDLDAENELIERYKGTVRQKAASYYMAGADMEDVVQEGMIGVFKAVRSYNETKGASFRTFVELCIQRQINSAIKLASRKKHLPLNNSLSLNRPLNDGDENLGTLAEAIPDGRYIDPENLLILSEEMELIKKRGLVLFTELERSVWEMYIAGCTYSEIAEKLDKTNKAVDNAIRRAKKKLVELLERSEK